MQITSMEIVGHRTPVGTRVPPGERVELTYGQALRVHVSLDYRGQGETVTLYSSIGSRKPIIGFDEHLHNEVPLPLPESPTAFVACQGTVDIPITSQISPGTDYDLYCKIREYPEAGLPEVDDVIDIVGIPPVYELIQEHIYPYAYVYDGDAEFSTFTFKSDPFSPANWQAERFAEAAADEVEKQGGRLMELRVYVDRTPVLWSDWIVEVVGTPLVTVMGMATAVAIAIWAAILIAALAIIALIVTVTWSLKTIVGIFQHKALSPEIKEAWSRETLIGCINDFEVKLELTPTPPEELEQLSDEELREYCDQLAEEIVPPVPGWGALAVVGAVGLGIVGLGAAFALARRK